MGVQRDQQRRQIFSGEQPAGDSTGRRIEMASLVRWLVSLLSALCTGVVPSLSWRRLRAVVVTAALILVALAGPGSPLAQSGPWINAAEQTILNHPRPRDTGGPDKPDLFNPRSDATSVRRTLPYPSTSRAVTGNGRQPQPLYRPFHPSMRPAQIALHAGGSVAFTSSDGRLSVNLPATAVTSAALTQAGGGLTLRIDQIAGGSGSVAGGSGEVSLGAYFVQLVNRQGFVMPMTTLHAPLTFTLHTTSGDEALDLGPGHALLVVNGAHPRQLPLAPLPPSTVTAGTVGHGHVTTGTGSTPPPNGGTKYPLGPAQSAPASFDSVRHTLTATLTPGRFGAVGGNVSFNTNSPVATFGNPDPFTVDLSGGGLTASYPIAAPSGPGGLTPQLALTYSSEAVAGQHNNQAPDPWVGAGFNLTYGSITWDQFNSNATC